MQAVQPAIGWASVNEPGQLAAKSTVSYTGTRPLQRGQLSPRARQGP